GIVVSFVPIAPGLEGDLEAVYLCMDHTTIAALAHQLPSDSGVRWLQTHALSNSPVPQRHSTWSYRSSSGVVPASTASTAKAARSSGASRSQAGSHDKTHSLGPSGSPSIK